MADISKVYPKDTEAPAGGVDDMTRLSYLHEPGVLENLKTRYELNEIYVCSLIIRFISTSTCKIRKRKFTSALFFRHIQVTFS